MQYWSEGVKLIRKVCLVSVVAVSARKRSRERNTWLASNFFLEEEKSGGSFLAVMGRFQILRSPSL